MVSEVVVAIATPGHPLFQKLLALLGPRLFSFPLQKSLQEAQQTQILFDFTLIPPGDKEALFKEFSSTPIIISDLTCYAGAELMEKHPQLKGALATAFPSPRQKVEAYAQNPRMREIIENFLGELGLCPHFVSSPGIGFHFPRILSTIINEAYLAWEDGLAEKEAIDTAMKYGVNYPLGPFEWTEKIGPWTIFTLLSELHHMTGEARYRPAHSLEKEAM